MEFSKITYGRSYFLKIFGIVEFNSDLRILKLKLKLKENEEIIFIKIEQIVYKIKESDFKGFTKDSVNKII